MIAVLVPAAGASSRMQGRDKLMEEIEDVPLIRRTVLRALTLGPVVVTLPAPDHPRARALAGLEATLVPVPDAAEGMAASIRAGLRALPENAQAVLILPADMPEIDRDDLARLAREHAAHPEAILRGASGETPGHPVLFPADLFPALDRIAGDEGARAVVMAHRQRLRLVPLAGAHALTDLDTPDDWRRWRGR